ncbi:hypothetical protein [Sphingobacterium siyangense]|uniref:Uncharacterized protein n=1 Tax=Sphingobacterium siyangense TaxID=459529 RepID=A0A562MQH8_9SPHI|nr:hypothetical protein [Sphingobacterium siyangense]TWI22205.1 hypothetical protein IQ31_01610 [Sphingobacterium siyangense]
MKGVGIQFGNLITPEDQLDLKIDIKRDSEGKIVSGLVIGNTVEQNKAVILISYQGEFKSDPDLGVGLEDILLDEDYLKYRHRIREHFAKDDLKVTRLDLYKDKPIIINAEY